ncbi:LptF/LptG family permease [bacterium]|nr:LptF/LptG family permease [bacterium]
MKTRILPRYLRRGFIGILLFCLLSIVLVFLIVDLVENLDQFIDDDVPREIILSYYLYYIPYVIILSLPVAMLMATFFSVGNFARHNEIVAMKSLGYSLYQVMRTLLGIGIFMSALSFVFAEGFVAYTNRKKEDIRRQYLESSGRTTVTQFKNLEVQEPPDKMVTIGYYDGEQEMARQVKIETFQNHRLVERLDTPVMKWDGEVWIVNEGFQRVFKEGEEEALPINQPMELDFEFGPEELLQAQVKPDEMGYLELYKFIQRVERLGGETDRWMTDLHMRIAFPLSCFIIILFSTPMAYNRRKKSLAIGFGLSLIVCFFYFGLIKIGESLGQNGTLHPFFAAWLGNGIMIVGGILNTGKTRK